MTELEELKKRVAELEKAANPEPRKPSTWQPIDYTAGMSMPRSAIMEMAKAIPESVMSALRADARKPNPVTGGAAPQPQAQPVKRGSGWAKPNPIESPPGIAHCD